ncbi:MAG: MipA/OmpV family protein [Epsilonproteobacteria bacterium]|nr:MipA/OmpV family protein [Campylobacterota bacterium]
MRYILILLLSFLLLNADEKKQKVTIGLGAYMQTQPYKNVDNIILPSPVIFFDNEIFYVRWSRAGLYFLGDKRDDFSWGFSLTIEPRVYGYDSSDILGMQERKNTWEGGLAFSAKTDKAYIEIMALTDILDRYKDWILTTEVGYEFKISNFTLYPSLIFTYQSSNFLNYYYGVKDLEQTATRTKYIPSSGFQIGIQTYIEYPLTKKLSLLLNIRADRLSKEATKSPIVEDKVIFSGLASFIYNFEY